MLNVLHRSMRRLPLGLPALLLASGPVLLFRNATRPAGIEFKLVSGSPEKRLILESMTGGVALFDYNSDGQIDIYLVNGSTIEAERKGTNTNEDRLFRNNGDGTYTDVTRQAGLGDRAWSMGVAAADMNNDGYDDLYVTNYGPSRLYLNNGDGTFRDFSRESGTNHGGWSSSAAFADYDGDGDLDLYVSRYLKFDVDNPPADGPLCRYRGIAVQCGPRGLPPITGRLYENLGQARFKDVTEESGIGAAPPSYGLGAVWGDYDNDGDPDLAMANDSLPNYLFRNNGNKSFDEVGLKAGVALTGDGREQAGMGVDFGDFDNDGDLDLAVTNFSDDYNTLYRNEGDDLFTDISHAAGLVQSTWPLLSWGIQFADIDNDGFLDLVIANGHVYPEVDRHKLGTTYRQFPSLFMSRKDGRFTDRSPDLAAALPEPESSRGLAVGDLNNDGSLDLVISHLDASPSLILNRGGAGHWLLLRLKGRASNRSAVGARVSLKAGSATMLREVKSGGSYQSHSDLRIHFGLGPATVADEITVRWPSGRVQKLKNVKADQILNLEEPPPDSSTGIAGERK